MSIIEKAGKLMSECEDITLASVNESGYPRICVLSKIKSDGIKKIYVTTGTGGTKTRHFQACPKASVCAWRNGSSITLIGLVAVRRDQEIREEMWRDSFIEHFPGGVNDPNYCVLEFTAEEATLWIDGEFVTEHIE